MDLLDAVQDPSDFPVDIFKKLDGSLRCPICQDLFDAPVILHCGHTFCSLCIRNLLPNKPECPVCRASAKEFHIIRNATFEEVVTAWSEARALTLKLAKESILPPASPPGNLIRGTKRKLSQQPEAGPSKLVRRGSAKSQNTPPEEDRHRINDEQSTPPDQENAVTCPLCNRGVEMSSINPHIDSGCKKFLVEDMDSSNSRQESDLKSKTAWKNIFKPQAKLTDGTSAKDKDKDSEIPETKLAKVSYGTMKLGELRKLLGDKGLSTTGERQELIQRHQKWIAIHNANLDRGQPKTSDLKRQLGELEEIASRPGPKKVKDEKEYTRNNKAQFDSLIEKARHNAKKTGEPVSEPEARSVPPSSSGPQITSGTLSSSPTPPEVIIID